MATLITITTTGSFRWTVWRIGSFVIARWRLGDQVVQILGIIFQSLSIVL